MKKRAPLNSTGKTRQRVWLWLAALTLAVTLSNLYIWGIAILKNRDLRYCYYHVDYNALYVPGDRRRIVGFRQPQRDHLVPLLQPAPDHPGPWTVTTDRKTSYSVTTPLPVIRLQQGLHTYTISEDGSGTPAWDVTLKINCTPREIYAAAGNAMPSTCHIVHSTLPVGRCAQYSVDTFSGTYADANRTAQARNILTSAAHIEPGDPTWVKIEKVGLFLLDTLDSRRGVPSADISSAHPMAQYRSAMRGDTEVWCSNFAAIYSFFANHAGIPTRIVSVGGTLDGIRISGHTFTESYIPERGQWAFVDLTSRKLFMRNDQGDFLNTLDLFHANRVGAVGGMTVRFIVDGEIQSRPYAEVNSSEAYYFNRDATFVFRKSPSAFAVLPRPLRQALKIVIDPDLAYSLCSSNTRYVLTVFLFYAEGILFLAWLWFLGQALMRRRRAGVSGIGVKLSGAFPHRASLRSQS